MEEPVRTTAEIEALDLERLTSARRRAWGVGIAGFAFVGALGFGYACSSMRSPPTGIVVGAIACSAVFIPAMIAAVIASVRAGRFNRRFAAMIDSIDPASLTLDPLETGDAIGIYRVLASDLTLLHLARRGDLWFARLRQLRYASAGIAACAAFIAALNAWGPTLGGLGHLPYKLLLLYWCVPFFGLFLIGLSVQPVPVQWYASRDTGSIMVDRITWLIRRDVTEVPCDSIRSFTITGAYLTAESGPVSTRLMSLPTISFADGLASRQARQLSETLTHIRARRIIAAIANVADLHREWPLLVKDS